MKKHKFNPRYLLPISLGLIAVAVLLFLILGI